MAYSEDLIKNLQKFSTVTERLDFYKSSKEKHSHLPVDATKEVITSLQIPIDIYALFFEQHENTAEFRFWFLRYNASLVLENIKEEKSIAQKLQSPLRDQILKGEIKKIRDIEDSAEQFLVDGVVDLYAKEVVTQYKQEIEYLRIKANYYQTNVLPSIGLDQEVVRVYAIHFYLKDFLEKEQQQFTGDILDVIALDELELQKEEPNIGAENENHVGVYDDHGLPPYAEARSQGTPVLKSDSIPLVCNLLEPYFSEQDYSYLQVLLETAQDAHKKLVFLSEGNKLADLFWQLYENNLVFNCQKSQLEKWVASNFQYSTYDIVKDFTLRYLNKIISTDHQKCKNPITDISKDFPTNIK